MAFYFPEGTAIYFSNTLGSAATVTAATNANPTVLTTSAAHGLVDNDEFLFTSGWEDATDRVFKADQLTTTTVSPLGLDTSNTQFYGVGGGTGTIQKVSSWLQIPQVLSVSTSGGDARFTTVDLLASRNSINIPTGFNAANMTLTLAHDPAAANYAAMMAISRTNGKVAIKMVVGGGAVMYGYGYMTVSEAPQLNRNQVNQVQAAIAFNRPPISYAS
jgi:hypothetical protein